MPLSVRIRFLLIALLINSTALAGLSCLALVWYRADAFRNLDTFLETDAQGLVDTIDSFMTAELHATPKEAVQKGIRRALATPEFLQSLQDAAVEHGNKPVHRKTTILVTDAQGRALFRTNSALPLEENLPNGLEPRTVESGGLVYRLISIPIKYHGFLVATVHEACLTDSIEAVQKKLILMLAVGLPLILLVASFIMAMLLSKVLHPVSRMSDTINRITATNLKLRVTMPPGNDELVYLARTFNGMLDRLEQSFSIQSRLVTDLSHQLRTPLAVLRGSLETGLRKVRSSSEYDEILSSNLEEVERIGRLIDGMLLLARIDSRSAELETGLVDLGALLRKLTDDLWPLWEQRSLKVVLEGGDESVVVGDERRLRQVFLSLLDNAWKYSPEGGTITIGIRGEEGFRTVSLMNRGTPIPDEDLERIFERFWRSKSAGATEGFGLGLAIARGIVELHGGRLWAENITTGEVVFHVRLPAAEGAKTAVKA